MQVSDRNPQVQPTYPQVRDFTFKLVIKNGTSIQDPHKKQADYPFIGNQVT